LQLRNPFGQELSGVYGQLRLAGMQGNFLLSVARGLEFEEIGAGAAVQHQPLVGARLDRARCAGPPSGRVVV
jgi:hypothetical protein